MEQRLEGWLAQLGDVARERRGELELWRRGERIFLVLRVGSDPLGLELGVGVELAEWLVGKYESVMRAQNMDSETWVEVVCSGQLSEDEVMDLVRLSYEKAAREPEA